MRGSSAVVTRLSMSAGILSHEPPLAAQPVALAQAAVGLSDYYTALADDKGMLRARDSDDGLHPNAKGYELIAPVAEAA